MKKQYIAPSMFAVGLQGISIIAEARMDGTSGINMNNVSADGGNAYDDAAVKGNANVWDEEW